MPFFGQATHLKHKLNLCILNFSFTWDGASIKVQEKRRKANHLELSSPWEVKNQTRTGKRKLLCFHVFCFHQKASGVVTRALPVF